ncbi:MAG: 30S ribosomal protein S18 [Spirochaetales bacterium]|nr:MAG: 30S ribosomal protein S18 [Spirochaetales bacterium]
MGNEFEKKDEVTEERGRERRDSDERDTEYSDRPDRRDDDDRSDDKFSNRGGGRARVYFRKKVCKFCVQNYPMDYKNSDALQRFITDRGKILPRRITGTCAKHQRLLSVQIKRARILALLPFVKQ